MYIGFLYILSEQRNTFQGSMSHTVNHFQASFLSEFTTNECQDLINLITLVHSNAEGGNDSRPFVIHCLYVRLM